jgi:hypothetical protein
MRKPSDSRDAVTGVVTNLEIRRSEIDAMNLVAKATSMRQDYLLR